MTKRRRPIQTRKEIPEIAPAGGTGSLDAAVPAPLRAVRRFLKVLGPGFITGASDDDPSGIGTYAIAGASFGFSTLWMALVTGWITAAMMSAAAIALVVTGVP